MTETRTHRKKMPSRGFSADQLRKALNEVFGLSNFRPHQAEVIQELIRGRDAFVVMPTGGGKSLCYQMPACLMEGTTLVVSPLISLMKDQVDAACAQGIRAAFLNSSQSHRERDAVYRELQAERLDLLYLAPERLALGSFMASLEKIPLRLIAVDEAHCISEWGHDFRPDYLRLGEMVERFPELPLVALTATATRRVQKDIIQKLGLRDPFTVRASFDRPNLFYRVRRKSSVQAQIQEFVLARRGQAGIIYRTTRASVEKTCDLLEARGIPAKPYHAGLSEEERASNQEAFNRDQIDVIVATIAFGMGIDKSNVRYVLHGDLPRNLESYYQESGRAGRDGERADCELLFGRGDISKIRYFIDQVTEEKEHRRLSEALAGMVRYAEGGGCRRRALLAYFGEKYGEEKCGACDVCRGEVKRVEASHDACLLLSTIYHLDQRFGIGQVVDVVSGAKTERIRELGHDRLSTYSLGAGHPKKYWRQLLDDLISQGIVERSQDRYPVLRLTPDARPILRGEEQFFMLERKDLEKKPAELSPAYPVSLFEELRALRLRLAERGGVPPYVIFSDRSLREMASFQPTSLEEFGGIHGVGEVKLRRYGRKFLEVIRRHAE